MKRNKHLCERVHFKKRLLERYGIKCNRYQYREILDSLSNDTFLLQQSNSKEIHEIVINGKPVWIALSTKRRELITALDYECELRCELKNADFHLREAERRHREIKRARQIAKLCETLG
jgi:hypothetical protein